MLTHDAFAVIVDISRRRGDQWRRCFFVEDGSPTIDLSFPSAPFIGELIPPKRHHVAALRHLVQYFSARRNRSRRIICKYKIRS